MKTSIKLTTIEHVVIIDMLLRLGIPYKLEWKNSRYILTVNASTKWAKLFHRLVKEEIRRRIV